MSDDIEADDIDDEDLPLSFDDAAEIIDMALYHASDRAAVPSAVEAFVSPIDVKTCGADPACTIPDALNNAMPSRRRLEFLCIAERIMGSPNKGRAGWLCRMTAAILLARGPKAAMEFAEDVGYLDL